MSFGSDGASTPHKYRIVVLVLGPSPVCARNLPMVSFLVMFVTVCHNVFLALMLSSDRFVV